MYYGKKSVARIDEYYGINSEDDYKIKDCEKIQQAFNNHAIMLTLAECHELYNSWSDEHYSAYWENGIEDYDLEQIFELLMPWLQNILEDRINRIEVLLEQLEKGGYIEII